jgi:hypothetical protein
MLYKLKKQNRSPIFLKVTGFPKCIKFIFQGSFSESALA